MLKVQKGKAYRIQVRLSDNLEQYAKDFLRIFNNVRANKELLKVYNTSGNDVFIVVEENFKDEAIDWLSWFAQIINETEVKTITPLVPITCTDEDFDEYSGDVEFLELDFE